MSVTNSASPSKFTNRVSTEGNLITRFQEEYGRVLKLLQGFSFCPENLPPATTSKKPFEKKTLEKQAAKKQSQVSRNSACLSKWFSAPDLDANEVLPLIPSRRTSSLRPMTTAQDSWYGTAPRSSSRLTATSTRPRTWMSPYRRATLWA